MHDQIDNLLAIHFIHKSKTTGYNFGKSSISDEIRVAFSTTLYNF